MSLSLSEFRLLRGVFLIRWVVTHGFGAVSVLSAPDLAPYYPQNIPQIDSGQSSMLKEGRAFRLGLTKKLQYLQRIKSNSFISFCSHEIQKIIIFTLLIYK